LVLINRLLRRPEWAVLIVFFVQATVQITNYFLSDLRLIADLDL
jgi:hypothetical protein